MQARRSAPMFSDVTAVAVARLGGAPSRGAVAPAPAVASLRRLAGTWHEPNAWTVGILLATGVALLARHPIARAIGTEVDSTPVAVSPAPAVTHPAAAPAAATAGGLLAAVPTHAPRDPFRALVNQGGKLLVPAAAPAVAKPAKPEPAVSTPTGAGSCTGTTQQVARGDSLWTIAARAVRSSDSDRVTIAWHRLYAANRATIGTDPSLLPVGATLCVPSGL